MWNARLAHCESEDSEELLGVCRLAVVRVVGRYFLAGLLCAGEDVGGPWVALDDVAAGEINGGAKIVAVV